MNLDDLGPEHLGVDGTYSLFLAGKTMEGAGPAPDFVPAELLGRPVDVYFTVGQPAPKPRGKGRAFRPNPLAASVCPSEWLSALSGVKLHPMRRKVAEALAEYADRTDGKNVRPAVATVADKLGAHRVNVNNHIKALVKAGWLTPTGKATKGVIIYSLTQKVLHNP